MPSTKPQATPKPFSEFVAENSNSCKICNLPTELGREIHNALVSKIVSRRLISQYLKDEHGVIVTRAVMDNHLGKHSI